MPQEIHVLLCVACETFQVQIVKKSSKWTCKICSTKQSVQKVYGKGTGAECREVVQRLNFKRGERKSRENSKTLAAVVQEENSSQLEQEIAHSEAEIVEHFDETENDNFDWISSEQDCEADQHHIPLMKHNSGVLSIVPEKSKWKIFDSCED